MNISYNLVYPSRKESPVRVIITHYGKVWRRSVGITVPTSTWKKGKTGNLAVDRRLKAIRIELESMLDEMSPQSDIPIALNKVLGNGDTVPSTSPVTPTRVTFWQYFAEYAGKDCPNFRCRKLAYSTIARLMGTSESWDGIDSAYYFRLRQRMDAEGYGLNYQATLIAKLKTVMNEGLKLKYHTNVEFKDFSKPSEETFAIALPLTEVEMLWGMPLDKEHLRKTRDLFVLGCYTAARFEDYSRLGVENLVGDRIEFIQMKTKNRVVLPCSPKVRTILSRYGGHAPYMNQVVFNRHLKELGRLAGFCEPMEVPKTIRKRLKKGDGDMVYRYELISSHTARRTGATNLVVLGVPEHQVMMLTGHKSVSAFRRYVRLTQQDNANLLASNPFFA